MATMTEKHVLLVKHSWSYVAGELDALGALFMKNLIRLRPEHKPIFRKLDNEKGITVLMQTIHHLVASLPSIPKAEKDLKSLLTEYSGFSLDRSHYDDALIAFLMTVEKKLGKRWNSEMCEAWVFLFAYTYQHVVHRPIFFNSSICTNLKKSITHDQ